MQPHKENHNPKHNRKGLKGPEFWKYSNMGFQMLAIILLGVFAGRKLDQYTGQHKPIFTVILTILSVIIAVYHSIKDLLKK